MKKDTLKLILISLIIHLLFYNPILLIILAWPIFGGYVVYINERDKYRCFDNFDKHVLTFLGCLLGPFSLLTIDSLINFNKKSFIKIPKIRNPFYYEE